MLEFIEDPGLILRVDPDTGVVNGHPDLTLPAARADRYGAAIRRELHRIRKEIHQDLLDLSLIGGDNVDIRGRFDRQADAMAARALAHERHRTC